MYKLKKDWTKNVVKSKSRLAILDCNLVEGLDYGETCSPVASTKTFQLIGALAEVLKLHLHQLNVHSAFLCADLDEEI